MKYTRLARIARNSALALVLFTAAVVVYIGTPWGTLWILRTAVRGSTGYQDAVLEARGVRGSRFTSLEIVDLRIRSGDSLLASIDTLRSRHRFAPLLRGTISLRDLVLIAPSLDVRGCMGSASSSPNERDTTESGSQPGWTVILDRGTVRQATVRRGECDSGEGPWTLEGLEANVHDVVIGEELTGRIDGLRASLIPAGAPDGYRADIGLSMELENGRLSVPSLTLDSPESRVAGGGVLRIPRDFEEVSDIDFELLAEPVALRDLAPFIGGLNEDGHARVDLRVTGTSRVLQVRAELGASDTGSVLVDASFAPRDQGQLRIDGSVQSRAFDASALLEAGPTGALDGDVEVDLRGPSMRELTGRMAVDLHRADPGLGEVVAVTLAALFTDGGAELEGGIELERARAAFTGWSRPFASRPELELTGDFGWDRRGPTDSLGIRLGGPFDVALSGGTLDEMSGRVGLGLEASMINRTNIPEATLEIELEDGAGEWRSSGLVGDGSIVGRGEVDFRGDRMIRVVSGVVRDLDPAALLGDSASSRLSGTLSGTLQITPGAAASAAGQVTLGRTWYGPFEVDSLTAEVRLLDARRIEAGVWTELLGGSAELAIEGTVADEWSAHVSAGSFRAVDLTTLTGWEDFTTSLDGSVTGELSTDATGLRGQLGLILGSSRINRLPLDTAAIDMELHEGVLTYLGSISYPSGELYVEGDGRPSDTVPSWRIVNARFTGLDVSTLVAEGGPVSLLAGHLSGSVLGVERDALQGQMVMSLASSRIGEISLRSGNLAASIEQGRIEALAEAALDGVDLEMAATLDLGEEPVRYEGGGAIRVTDLGRMLSSEGLAGDLAGTFDFRGEGMAPDSRRLAGGLRLTGGQVQGLPLDSAKVVGRLAAGTMSFDTLGIWSEAAVVRGDGNLAFTDGAESPTSLAILGTAAGVEPLRAWLGWPVEGLTRASVHVAMTGPTDRLRIRTEAEGEGLSFGDFVVARFDVSGEASLDDSLRVEGLEARASAQSLQWGELPIHEARLSGRSDGDQYLVSGDAAWDERRRGRFAGSIGMDERGADVRLTELTAEVDQDSWTLDRGAFIRVEEGLTVNDLRLSSPAGSLGIDGFIGSTGEQSFEVVGEGLRLHSLAALLGYEDLTGTLAGAVEVTGTAASPVVAGDFSAEMAFRGGAPGQLSATVRYDSLRLAVNGSILHPSGQQMRLEGRLPLRLTLAPADSIERGWSFLDREPLALDLAANEFGIEWFTPFLDPDAVRDLQGVLDVDVRVRGSGSDPALDGSVVLAGGSVLLTGAGIRLEEALLRARLEGRRVVIERTEARSGRGTLSADGQIDVRSSRLADLDLRIQLDDFDALRSEFLRATLDGDLTLRGTNAEPRLVGTIDVLRGDVLLDGRVSGGEAETVELSEADYAMLEERFGYRPPAEELGPSRWREPMAFAIDVRLGQDTWIRQRAKPEISIQLNGDLRIDKEPNEPESIVGTLEALPRRSYVVQFGRRFDLTRGSVVFNGRPQDLQVDIETAYEVPSKENPDAPEIVITLGVQGGAEDLSLILSSDPVVENADIVSYLAMGRPANQSLQAASAPGTALLEQGTGLALDRVTGLVEGFANENVGLDIVEIRPDGVNGVTVIAGRYMSPRLYLGLRQPMSRRRGEASVTGRSRTTEIEIEYQTFRSLLLSLQATGSRIGFFLRSRHAY